MPTRSNTTNSSRPNTVFIEQASVVSDGFLAETIFDPTSGEPRQFAVCREGAVTIEPSATVDSRQIGPPGDRNRMMENGIILLPSECAEYESETDLFVSLKSFIHQYVDVPPFWEDLIVNYVLMTWVYDRFSAVPYLRFLGEPGTGKSRCLQVAGHLCYKAITAGGATTASPLFRLLEVYGGTFIADEADFKNSDAWAEIIKILSCGYMQGLPVLRSEKVKDSFEPRAYDVFGPKIIAGRARYTDHALETRCLCLETQERQIRSDIPRQLPPQFFKEAQQLRNMLLG